MYEDSAESGRVMSICLHPFISGHAFRSKYLAEALAYVTSRQDVWVTTGAEIIDAFKAQVTE
jgi:predicted glycosyltransferase